jgi:integration host factor subunit beta
MRTVRFGRVLSSTSASHAHNGVGPGNKSAEQANTLQIQCRSEGDMQTITKKELIDRIAEGSAHKRVVVKKIIQKFLDEIIDELGRGNRLEFRDFGVFESKQRAARTAQNPKTLERVSVPSKRTVKFKVGRLMKIRLSEPSQPAHASNASPAASARPS